MSSSPLTPQNQLKLSIIIPCYNEITTIGSVINKVQSVELPISSEIVIVDDFSVDGTVEYLQSLTGMENIKVCFHDKNRGKGAALRTGFASADGDILLIQDADLEYDPLEYHKLIKPFLDGKADVVYGSRFVGGEEHRVLYFWHYLGNKFLTLFSNMFTNLNLTDMEVGYKAFRRSLLEKIILQEDRFGFEPEFTAKISRLKCAIFEVGISYSGRTYAEGKKINWKDGFRAIYVILKYGLLARNTEVRVHEREWVVETTKR